MGVIDGSDSAREIREATGNQQFVAVDRPALVPEVSDDLPTSVRLLGGKEGALEPKPDSSKSPSLLESVTRRFKDEQRKATDRFEGLVDRIRNLPMPETKERIGASLTVKACIWVSIIFAALALTTLLPDKWMTFGLDANARMVVFVWTSAPPSPTKPFPNPFTGPVRLR